MFTLTIETDNAAFEDDLIAEVVATLQDAARQVAQGRTDITLLDGNGNTVGRAELT